MRYFILPSPSDASYIHIKGKSGSHLVAIISDSYIAEGTEYSKTEMQTILNEWIDEENAIPEIDSITGLEIRQEYINLDWWS